ncbi:3'(2'),5'-bisphosphate nucleotidase CysQ [Sphingomonas lycopersici]|uniref:3'(2'),5'-bisphosphate nucleotidase CysQ n=1 Tax=Sphingomonas lycopersici TaxID=2951807 RepID=UPI00254653F0|nr:3'(2'),5'-bisphosphate nucleotidase CysQ [Sphingomonas lycopersici]
MTDTHALSCDAELAAQIAETAGRLLLDLRDSGLITGKALGKAGDLVANAFILEALKAQRPDDGVLSEESVDDPVRLEKSRVWIVDPLDGTREYSEGRGDWAVHIALAIDGAPAIGAVALPGQDLVLRTDAPPADQPRPERVRLLVSRTRPPAEAEAVAAALGAELVPMGSAGAKAMAVLLGQGDIYLHAGGQYEWDNCAPAAVALAAGYEATRIDGAPLRYNSANPSLPDLLICPKHLTARVRAALGSKLTQDNAVTERILVPGKEQGESDAHAS